MITCLYCQHRFVKKCKLKNKNIECDDKICDDDFYPSKYFYCDKEQNRLDVIVCINRQNKKHTGCMRCKQKKIIRTIYNRYIKENKL